MTTKKIKTTLIGFGYLGKWHYQKMKSLENCQVVAVVESSPQAKTVFLQSYPKDRIVADLDEVLEESEAFILATPTSTHFDLVKKLLSKNKHVFCEKPFTSTYAQALELANLAKEKKVCVQIGHSERCHQAWDVLKSEKYNRFIKDATFVEFKRVAPFKGRATDVDVAQDLMIHDLDLLLYLTQMKPKELSAKGIKTHSNQWDYVHCDMLLNSKNRYCQTSLVVGRNNAVEERYVEFISQHGAIRVDMFKNTIIVAAKGQGTVEELSYTKRDHLLLEQDNFYYSIANNSKALVDADEGTAAVFLVESVLKSIEQNRSIQF